MQNDPEDTQEGAPSRRERLRAELEREAREEARRLTAAHGLEGLTLSAVARNVGVSPPALYRYFDGKKGLILAVYEDLTREFVSVVAGAALRESRDDLGAQIYAATRTALDWTVEHPAEFDLLMGAGYARLSTSEGPLDRVLVRELGGAIGLLFTELWRQGKLDFLADNEIDPDLLKQVVDYRDLIGLDHPAGVALLMITCWRQIYGLLCMAVNRHLTTSFDDFLPLFDHMMDNILSMLGVTRAQGQH